MKDFAGACRFRGSLVAVIHAQAFGNGFHAKGTKEAKAAKDFGVKIR